MSEKNPSLPDPNKPMSPEDLPAHMRHIVKKPGTSEEAPLASTASSSPPQNLRDTTTEEERIQNATLSKEGLEDKPWKLHGLDGDGAEDDGEDNSARVLGVDVATDQKIVRPKKLSDNPFAKASGDTSGNVYDGPVDVAAILKHVQKSTDYVPFQLPSCGYLYPKNTPWADGKVLIRPMRGDDEEILLSPNLLKDGEAIEMIFRNCIAFEDRSALVNPLQMLSQDRTAALIAIRGMTYGREYLCEVSCEKCGTTFQSPVDLEEDINVIFADDPTIKEPFPAILPKSGLPFKYRLPRGVDERAIIDHVNARKKKDGKEAREDSTTFRALLLITEIAGITTKDNPKGVEQIINKISLDDRAFLRECFDYPPFGVDTRVNFECWNCGHENKRRLPMGIPFFIRDVERQKKSKTRS